MLYGLDDSRASPLLKGKTGMSISETQKKIVEEFQSLNSWEDRYKKIIEKGRALPELTSEKKTDENLVKGCQSKVWLTAQLDGQKVIFEGDSDASIVKGLVALLLEVYSGNSPAEILANPPEFIEQLGLNANLSQTRASGLASMVRQMKFYAIAFQSVLDRR
jgi:cysteine desulfuration protein SufE